MKIRNLFVDIETTAIRDGSLPDKIHCVCLSIDGEEPFHTSKQQFKKLIKKTENLLAHNGIWFDFPILETIWGCNLANVNKIDTLVMSMVAAPHLRFIDDLTPKYLNGKHKLEAWGRRVGLHKGDYAGGWGVFNKEMLTYCLQDVRVLVATYNELIKSPFYNEEVLAHEYKVQEAFKSIKNDGIALDVERLEALQHQIRKDMQDATKTFQSYGFNGNPNSRQQVAKFLIEEHDWKPTEFTDKAKQPKVNGDTLPQGFGFRKYYLTKKPLSQAVTLLNHVFDGKVFPSINTSGTRTGRFNCYSPNLQQIPAVRYPEPGLKPWDLKYGIEFRSVFTAPKGYTLVGADLSSLELRCMADALMRYGGRIEWIEMLDGGKDVHADNQEKLHLTNRTDAKRVVFACVPMHSEALTREGWKTYGELEVGEEILTYNQDDNVTEWKPLQNKVRYDDAPVIEMSVGKSFVVQSTPNHRWFCKKRRDGGRGGRYYEDMVVTTENLHTEHHIICNAPHRGDNRSGNRQKWINIGKYKNNWVEYVLGCSQEQRQAFLAGVCIADGWSAKKKTVRWSIAQNRGHLCEAMTLASYLVHDNRIALNNVKSDYVKKDGTTSVQRLSINFQTRQHVTCQKLKKTAVGNHEVWCPVTENGSWVMRQNDTITITGNTVYGGGGKVIGKIICDVGDSELKVRIKGIRTINNMKKNIPGYNKTLKLVTIFARKHKYIELPSGRKLYVAKPFTAFNTLLQGMGAEVAKYWLINALALIKEREIDAKLMIQVHDEMQFICKKGQEHQLEEVLHAAVAMVQDQINLLIEQKCEVKIGDDWGVTH